MMRWALVSGASTGLGRSITMRLLREGVSVFAGIRRDQDGDELSREGEGLVSAARIGKLVPLRLDVVSEDQIRSAIEKVSQTVSSDGLWALVNNAGIVIPGPIEFLTASDWRRQFDVNFFGLIELTRVSLPLLRQAVSVQGFNVPRIMLVSSIGGRVAQPILAPYTSSKWAVTGLGDSLRLELRRQGIGVTVLEPGAVATAIWGKGERSSEEFHESHPARRFYGPEIDGLTRLARRTAAMAIAPEKAAEEAVEALLQSRAPARVLVGRDAKMAAVLHKWLPLSWFDSLLLKQYGVNDLPTMASPTAETAAT